MKEKIKYILEAINALLLITTIISITSLIVMSKRASYHMKQHEHTYQVMESLVDRIYEDNLEYYVDVLSESEEFAKYEEIEKVMNPCFSD